MNNDNRLPDYFDNKGRVIYSSPSGRVSIFSMKDAVIVFNCYPHLTEVYAINLENMTVCQVSCLADAAIFFEDKSCHE